MAALLIRMSMPPNASRAFGGQGLRDAASDVGAGPGDNCNLSFKFHRSPIQRAGGAVTKHFEELKIQVPMNSASAGLRLSSASAPARHIQLSSSCCPLS